MKQDIEVLGKQAKASATLLQKITTKQKNQFLQQLANLLIERQDKIKEINNLDVEAAKLQGIETAFIDRLTLNDARIQAMAEGLNILAKTTDPIGEIIEGWKHENGMIIEKKRVPLGVLGMIYESRPNVTIDAVGLAIKSSNVIILRGSANALQSNRYLVTLIAQALEICKLPQHTVQFIDSADRKCVNELVQLDEYIDVLIPRGGKKLKQFILTHATIPVIETGMGICHVYVDQYADTISALKIILNAKIQRPGVCNSIETILLHQDVAKKFLPTLTKELRAENVQLHYDNFAYEFMGSPKDIFLATETTYEQEYLDLAVSLRVVGNIDEAIQHINFYGTHHSDTIITENYLASEQFLNEVDSAVVYVNASTRFSDGGEFGFGGEIGIATQKLHARGPMGIKELTTYKYIVRGNGQIK